MEEDVVQTNPGSGHIRLDHTDLDCAVVGRLSTRPRPIGDRAQLGGAARSFRERGVAKPGIARALGAEAPFGM